MEAPILNDASRRCTQYTFADKCMENLIRNFTETQASTGISLEDLRSIHDFLIQYENNGSVSEIPFFGELNTPFPVKYLMIIGGAGTGKSTALQNMLFKDNTMTVVGTTNPACNNFISELSKISKPHTYSTNGIIRNTIHKLLYIDYNSMVTRNIYNTVLENKELHDVCNTHATKIHCLDAEKELRSYWKCVLKHLYPLYKKCVSNMQKEFTLYKGYRYQLVSNGSEYKFNISKDLLFPTDFQNQNKDNAECMFYDKNHATSNVNIANLVDSQLAFLQYVAMIHSKKPWESTTEEKPYPNPLILRHKIIVEEAGRMASPLTTLMIMLWWRINFMYNTPQLRTTVPIIFLSGSETQSGVIGFPTSMLDELLTPVTLCKKNEILAIASEFNRRRKNNFEHPISEMHKVLCTHFEKHIAIANEVFDSLIFCEVFKREVNDPNFHTDALRIYQFHKDCSAYDLKLKQAEKATVEVYDTVYVSSNIITVTAPILSTITDEYISILSEKEAEHNRMVMWKQKAYLYDDTLKCSTTPIPNIHNCSSFEKNTNSENGFDEKYEEYIMSVFYETKKNRAFTTALDSTSSQKSAKKQKIVTDIEDCVEYDEAAKQNQRDNNLETTREDLTFRYIIGPARFMLSNAQHKRERLYSRATAKKLGNGEHLSKLYYESSKVTNQTGEIFYDPYYDVCIQIADPDYSLKDDELFKQSIAATATALQTFLGYRRKRNFVNFSGVTNAISRTKVKFKGVHGTLRELLLSHEFMNMCPETFKVCIYSQIIAEFKSWIKIHPDVVEYSSFQALWDSYSKLGGDSHIQSDVTRLCNTLYAMVNALYKNVKLSSFTNNHHMKLYVENDVFWFNMRYTRNAVGLSKSFPLQDLKLLDIGHLSILGNGLHECNVQENQRAYSNKLSYFLSNTNNTWEEYQHEKGKKNASRVFSHEVPRIFPDLVIQSAMTLLVKDLLVVVTAPEFSNRVRWNDVFLLNKHRYGECREEFGLLSRRECAPITAPTAPLFHNFASRPYGELMNFPKPFISRSYNHLQTDIILKTANSVEPLSSKYKVLDAIVDSSTNQTRLKETDLDETTANVAELRSKKSDLHFTMHCLMNSMFPLGAVTVDSTQGQTVPKYVTNLSGIDHTKLLVTMTRGENCEQIYIAGVNEAQSNLDRIVQSAQYRNQLHKSRTRYSAVAPYIQIRQ